MSSDVFVLCGYACNGKSSLLPALKWNLEMKYPNKSVIVVDEPVEHFVSTIRRIMSDKYDDIIKDTKLRQSYILTSALAQLNLVFEVINNIDDIIVIMDRNIVDVLSFCKLYNIETYDFQQDTKVKKAIDAFNYIYLLPPKNTDILMKCFEREVRSKTIEMDDFYSKESSYRRTYALTVKNIKYFNHPGDNTYVLFKILNYIESKLD